LSDQWKARMESAQAEHAAANSRAKPLRAQRCRNRFKRTPNPDHSPDNDKVGNQGSESCRSRSESTAPDI